MLGLSFLSPWFLLGLAAAAGPLVLHLFSRENAPLTVLPTARFVMRVPVEQTRRRHLQDLWLLLLRLAAIVLLALAFARPFFTGPEAAARQEIQVLAVDRSFSMAGEAREAETSRQVREAVERMPTGAPAALVTFDQEARILVAPTSNRRALLEQADRLKPGLGSTSLASALRAAVDVAQGRPARLIVVTDGQQSGADGEVWPELPANLDVEFRTVPAAPDNLSVDLVEGATEGVAALVRNHGLTATRARVRWMVDGREVTASMVDLPAAGALDVRLERSLPDRALVSVTVDDATGYAADNTRFLVTDPPRALPVLLVSSVGGPRDAGLYLQSALQAVETRQGAFDVSPVAADDPRLAGSEALTAARVIVVVGTRGMERRARMALAAAVRDGRGLLVAAGPAVEPGVVREILGLEAVFLADDPAEAGAESVAVTDVRHPVLAALGPTVGNLGQVRVDERWIVREPAGGTALMRFSTGAPALLELHPGSGRALLLATDAGRRWNTWPVHPTFLPFVVGAVRYLAGERLPTSLALVGDPQIEGEGTQPGVVTSTRTGTRMAVNVDPGESRVEALGGDELTGRLRRAAPAVQAGPPAAAIEGSQELWRWLLWALLGLLALEALVATRRRRNGHDSRPASAAAATAGEGA
jgi:hypothetical protein